MIYDQSCIEKFSLKSMEKMGGIWASYSVGKSGGKHDSSNDSIYTGKKNYDFLNDITICTSRV